jgi:hypothetical protein
MRHDRSFLALLGLPGLLLGIAGLLLLLVAFWPDRFA